MSNKETWLLVDGTGIAHKIFNVRKTLMHAETHVRNWLHSLRKDLPADRWCVAWDDCKDNNWRKVICPEYKAHRDEKVQELVDLLEKLKTASFDGFENMSIPGCEADDVIATLAFKANLKSVRAIMVSSDADLHQCLFAGSVNQLTKFSTDRGAVRDCKWMTYNSFLEKFGGVVPAQWPQWKAIVGDTDIAGLDGLGDSAATKILTKYATVEDAAADQWGLPLNDAQRVTFMNAWNSGHLQNLCKVHRLRRDLDIA